LADFREIATWVVLLPELFGKNLRGFGKGLLGSVIMPGEALFEEDPHDNLRPSDGNQRIPRESSEVDRMTTGRFP
jgi:hypothetical protein